MNVGVDCWHGCGEDQGACLGDEHDGKPMKIGGGSCAQDRSNTDLEGRDGQQNSGEDEWNQPDTGLDVLFPERHERESDRQAGDDVARQEELVVPGRARA